MPGVGSHQAGVRRRAKPWSSDVSGWFSRHIVTCSCKLHAKANAGKHCFRQRLSLHHLRGSFGRETRSREPQALLLLRWRNSALIVGECAGGQGGRVDDFSFAVLAETP